MATFGTDSHPGKEGCLRLEWNNPYIGSVGFERKLQNCPDVLGSGDASTDYAIDILTRGTGGEGDKWTEWVSAAGIGPFDLWHTNGPTIFLSLRPKNLVRSGLEKEVEPGGFEATLHEPIPLKLGPINGAPSDTWEKRWINAYFKEQASININIKPGPVIMSGYFHKSRLTGEVRAPTIPQSYIVDITDKFSSINLHQENVLSTPVITLPYKGEIWKREDTGKIVYSTRDSISLPISGVIWVTKDRPIASSGMDEPMVVTEMSDDKSPSLSITGVKADGMLLENNITLQLYGDYNPAKELVNFRLRYLRTTDGGTILEDVILH